MKIKCIIVDDEPIACEGLKEYVQETDMLELAGVFDNALQAYAFLGTTGVDLLFADIEMPRLSGIDLLASLKEPPVTIFITAYPSYALQGFELGVADYLVKPVSLARFQRAVERARDMILVKRSLKAQQHTDSDCFFIKEDGNLVKVYYDDLLYVQALQNYVALYLSGRRIISYITLSQLEQQLPAGRFMRIHKSYIVALQAIGRVEGNTAVIGQQKLPISRRQKDKLLQKLTEDRLLKRR